MILGITGTDGSGKGTVVEYLTQEKGFIHYSARALFMNEIKIRGIEANRANMRIVANDLRKIKGDDFVVTESLAKISADKVSNAVIESVRAYQEAKTLKAHGGILIAVDADQKTRYARVQERRSESDRVTFEEFVAHEALEMHDPDPHGMQKAKVIAMADTVIQNNGTREELFKKIEAFLMSIEKSDFRQTL